MSARLQPEIVSEQWDILSAQRDSVAAVVRNKLHRVSLPAFWNQTGLLTFLWINYQLLIS